MNRVRALVVDDSASMRALIRSTLEQDPAIEVVGQAADAMQAREAIKALNPDVMTLDIEMPRMNGIEFLEKVMRLRPLPVVMISSLTERGATATMRALEIGAVDCILKPCPEHPDSFAQLADKVKAAAMARFANHRLSPLAPAARAENAAPRNGKLVAIGASTGGVEALVTILRDFPVNCAATLVTIHLPSPFTQTFVQRLDRLCAPKVVEASHGALVVPGTIYVAPGSVAHLEYSNSGQPKCILRETGPINGHRPSVDALFLSVAKCLGSRSVGVILTGMGSDGVKGLLAMRQAGARTIGQDEATCVVYGMPKIAYQVGAVEKQLGLTSIASEIATLTSASRTKEPV
jgi:two-component system chemotaxis response regulator CheB